MILLILVLASIFLLLYMYIEAHRIRVKFETVKLDKLPPSFKNFKIFFISDIHRRSIDERLIQKAGDADIVIIGGDLVEKGVAMDRAAANIKELSKIGPVCFVWGNNDYDVDTQILKNVIIDNGALILDNSCMKLYRDKEAVDILAVNDTSLKKDRLAAAVRDCSSSCRILISHNPDITEKITHDHQISLILSGHTHGGQIRLGPFGIAKKGGWYKKDSYQLLISNGFGATHLPLRFGAPSETHLITLV